MKRKKKIAILSGGTSAPLRPWPNDFIVNNPANRIVAGRRILLLRYLKAHEREIDIAPLVEVAESIRTHQNRGAARK